MKNFADIRSYLHHTWRDRELVTACEAIIDYIEKADWSQLALLTYPNLRDIARRSEVDAVLLSALSVLSASQMELLEPHFLFSDHDGREFDLRPDQINALLKGGELIHPVTGEVVDEAEDHLIPYFAATTSTQALKGRTGG